MKFQYVLPAAMFALMTGAAAVYLYQGDWRRGGYWVCAAAITFFVTV